MPVIIFLEWLIVDSTARLKITRAFWVLVYPLIWLILTMLRGSFTDGWWPYWFINPGSEGGVVAMLTYIFAIAAAFIALGFVVLGIRLSAAKMIGADNK